MKYKVSVIKKIAFLVMTMALAGAMVACKGAVGPAGPPGPPAETPTTPTTPTTPPTTPPTTTPPTPIGNQPPTVVAVPAFTGTVGVSADVNLGLFFSDPDGDTLTYTATSDDTDVATVSVAGSTLTIAGVAIGTATISVTGTDPAGASVTGTTTLTVGPAVVTDTAKLPPATLKVGDFKVLDLAKDERLTSSAQRVVSVESGSGGDATKWTVRAEAKGTATVRLIGADGQMVNSVDVTVPNQAPTRTAMANPRTSLYYPLEAGADGLSTTNFFLGPFFTDPDGDALKYTFSSQSAEVLFVKATDTSAGKCCIIFVDVLSETHESASIVVFATDSDDAPTSGTVEFQVGIDQHAPVSPTNDAGDAVVDPGEVVARSYDTDQQTDGDLATIVRVELRKHVNHTLNFIEVTRDGDVIEGFKFAKDFDTQLVSDDQLGPENPFTATDDDKGWDDAGYVKKLPVDDPTDNEADRIDVGFGVYMISARNGDPVVLDGLVPDPVDLTGDVNVPPSMTFAVTGTGSAVVTVSYHVWDTDLNDDETLDDRGWRMASETVNIDISQVPEYMGADGKFPK